MLGNDIWQRTNQPESVYFHYCVQGLMDRTGQYFHNLDWPSFPDMDDEEIMKRLERILIKDVEKDLSKKNIEKDNMYQDIGEKQYISQLDCYKLYVNSSIIHPFWEFNYWGLLCFYKECYLTTENYNINQFLGKINYIFNTTNDDELFILQNYVNSKYK